MESQSEENKNEINIDGEFNCGLFLNELDDVLEKISSGYVANLNSAKNITKVETNINDFFQIIEQFKYKYENINFYNLTNEARADFSKNLLKIFREKFEKFENSGSESLQNFYDIMIEFFDFFPKLYDIEDFKCNNNTLQKSNEYNYLHPTNSQNYFTNLKNLFFSIGYMNFSNINSQEISLLNPNLNLNEFLDALIINLIENSDPKILFVMNNILTKYTNTSTFLSFKLILINLMIQHKLHKNYKFFSTTLSNIGNFLLPESILFGRKLNEELFENKFTDFSYDTAKTNARKLSKEEFEFLIKNLFPILNFVIDMLLYDGTESEDRKDLEIDLIRKDNRSSLTKLIDNAIETGKIRIDFPRDIKLYQNYLVMCFVSDCFEFIFSNLHYLDSSFRTEKNLNINTNPFDVFKEDIQPQNYKNFIDNMFNFIQNKFCSDFVTLIEIYLASCEIKNTKLDIINELVKNDDGTYFIYEPFNSVGFPLVCWLIWKKNLLNIFPICYSPLYILDVFLPLGSALIKRGQNFRMMGIDLLFGLVDIVEESAGKNLSSFKFYSYEDVFRDLLEFIGGPDIEIKRIFVSNNLHKIIKILSHEAKKELFLLILKDILKENSQNVNDAQASFVIYTLKNILSESIRLNKHENNSLFEEKFLKEIVNLSVNKNLFVIDILETISKGLNFLHFIIIQDKTLFEGRLRIYNKDYFHEIEKNIDIIAKLIEKWINSNDEEKMKHVIVDTSELKTMCNLSEKKEEFKRNFELRKNQAILAMNMIDNIGRLIRKNLNSIK